MGRRRRYDRISGPMQTLGQAVLDRLRLRGDETVLDAGCGSGRITAGADPSACRAGHVDRAWTCPQCDGRAAARERLGPGARRAREASTCSRARGFAVEEPVDAILSTATFHWVADHAALFRSLHGVLAPGGRLVAQCGGEGNIDVLRARASASSSARRSPTPSYFASFSPAVELRRPGGDQGAGC